MLISRRFIEVPAIAFAMLGMASCASAPPPTEEIAAAKLAVRQVQNSPAQTHAPAEVRQARNKLEAAERAMDAEAYVKARRLAEQATVDAQLADVKTDAAISETSRETIEATIKSLESETLELSP